MTPDDVIALRRKWEHFAPALALNKLPKATVLATTDWLAYVLAMADAIEPSNKQLVTPSIEECRWAWPDGVLIVFGHDIEIEHTVVSHTDSKTGLVVHDVPHFETQVVRALVFNPPVETDDPSVYAHTTVTEWLGIEATGDITQGWYHWGLHGDLIEAHDLDHIGGSTRLLLALVNALGHRLTTLNDVSGLGRAAQRRMGRELPGGLRVLELTNASSKPESRGGSVEWTHRWVVRGHWRNQPCGPGNTLRKMIWIDSFIKGPEDMPLDVRPTIWETTIN